MGRGSRISRQSSEWEGSKWGGGDLGHTPLVLKMVFCCLISEVGIEVGFTKPFFISFSTWILASCTGEVSRTSQDSCIINNNGVLSNHN